MSNYDGYGDSCGGYGQGCSVGGGCGCGNDYKTCSPDYSPVTVSNSTCPNVEGSTSAGGSSYGNSSTVSVNMCGYGCGNDKSSCCRDGAKKLLQFISKKSLETGVVAQAYVYGDILATIENLFTSDTTIQLLSLNDTALNNISICDELARTDTGVVSLCSVSLITFLFTPTAYENQNQALKEQFKLVKNCSCSCECGNAMAEALCFSGLGGTYTVVIQDALVTGSVALASLTGLILVAVDCNMAIFSDNLENPTKYYGIPTCRIAKILRTA